MSIMCLQVVLDLYRFAETKELYDSPGKVNMRQSETGQYIIFEVAGDEFAVDKHDLIKAVRAFED